MNPTDKPLPVVTDLNRPFWDGADAGALRVQRCRACGHRRFPVAPVCPHCLSPDADWVVLSGRGAVHAYAVYHRAFGAAFAADLPYVVAVIQLDEGPRMLSNVVGAVPVEVGQRVRVGFETRGEGVAVPYFRLDEEV